MWMKAHISLQLPVLYISIMSWINITLNTIPPGIYKEGYYTYCTYSYLKIIIIISIYSRAEVIMAELSLA